MVVNQIYALVNAVSKDMWGESALAVKDLSGLIAMGEAVYPDSNNRDRFVELLSDRIGRTVIRKLNLDVRFPNIIKDNFEYGAILQKLTIDPMDAIDMGEWDVGSMDADDVTAHMFKIDKWSGSQKLFSGINAWEIDLTIPDKLLKTAFQSAEGMGAYISAVMSAMVDSMTMQLNYTNTMCVNNFIADTIDKDTNVVHLLREFNSESGTLTAAEAFTNEDFLKFASFRIGQQLDFIKEPSVLFNDEGKVRTTQRDNAHVFLLSSFTRSVDVFLQSSTFHDQYTALPGYYPVTCWQQMGHVAIGDDPDDPDYVAAVKPNLTTASTINIKTSAGATVNQAYVIGAVIDREALGTTIFDRETTADRLNRLGITQYTNKMSVGYFNDRSENSVVFVVD